MYRTLVPSVLTRRKGLNIHLSCPPRIGRKAANTPELAPVGSYRTSLPPPPPEIASGTGIFSPAPRDQLCTGNTTGYITPLLFARTPGPIYPIYTVVGIGRGSRVALSSAPQEIRFELVEGLRIPPNGEFTFGFVNAIVNSNGVPIATSKGVVDYDEPPDSGPGVGGTGTINEWAVTTGSYSPSPAVALGTTFAVSGADYTFWPSSRTYSAEAIGVAPAQ
jgi:hypothetical protein